MTLRAGYEPLLEAIRDADIPSLERLLNTNQYSVNTEIPYQSEDGKPYIITPLYWAVKVGQPSVCRFLLHKKADPYRHMVYEYYPLHEACSRGNKEIVQEFIWGGCNLDQPNCDGDTPLHIASMRGHVECIKLLLNAGANYKARNSKGETPLEAGRYTNQTDLHKLFEVFDKGHVHQRVSGLSSSSRIRSSSTEAANTRLTPPRQLYPYVNGSRDDSSVGGASYGPKRKTDVSRTYSFSGVEPSRCYANLREPITYGSGSGHGKSPSPTSLLLQAQSRTSPQRSSLANMSHDSQLILPTQTLISDPRRTQTYHDFGASLPFSEDPLHLHSLLHHSPNEIECDSTSGPPASRLSAPKLRVQNMIHHLNESVSVQYGSGIDSVHVTSLLSSVHGDLGFDSKEYESLCSLTGEFCSKRLKETGRHVDSAIEYVWGCDYEMVSNETTAGSPICVAHGSPTPNYAEMVFKVKLHPQASSERSLQNRAVLLRVITKIFDLGDKDVSELYHSRSYMKTECTESQILTSLPPHPNIPRLLHYCPAHSRPFERFTRNFCPNESHISLKMAPEVHLLFLADSYSSFQSYLSTKQQLQPVAPYGFKERTAILLLTQLFLALSHLDQYGVIVTHLSPSDILFDARHHLVLIGLSHSLSINGKDSSELQDLFCEYSPKTLLGFSPELAYLRDCSSLLLSEVPPLSLFLKSSNAFTVARFFTEVFNESPETLLTTAENIPELNCFSPRLRTLVKKVLTLGQDERPTSLQSALCCFLLLFGPPEGECTTITDCQEWLVSEICSFYLRPSLKGQPHSYLNSDIDSRLLFTYLLIATPESLLSAVKLVYDT